MSGHDELISIAVAEGIASWKRIFANRANGVDERGLLRNAAVDLCQTLEIDKTVHPESHNEARQDVVDALQNMAESADILPDDAHRIFAESFKAPPTNGYAYSEKDDQRDQQNIESRWDDPDISILDDRRGTLPEFPLEVLPLVGANGSSGQPMGAALPQPM